MGVGGALAMASMAFAPGAEARMTSSQRAEDFSCGFLQDLLDQAYASWNETSLVGADSDAAWAKLMDLYREWQTEGCQAKYGDPFARPAPQVTGVASANFTSGNNIPNGNKVRTAPR
jgi:hypothetical protein